MDGREFLKRLERRHQHHTEQFLHRLVETPERRKQREALEEEERLRRELAKIGYTPEEFEAAVQEFRRKFPIGDG